MSSRATMPPFQPGPVIYKPWPTLTHHEARLMLAKADAVMNASSLLKAPPKRIPEIIVPSEGIEAMRSKVRATAETRGALPLWIMTGMA